jgi:murein DD-endopeptidase MepM/ murein hydrolase activator NlpD
MKILSNYIIILVLSLPGQTVMGQSEKTGGFKEFMENLKTEFAQMIDKTHGAVQNMLTEITTDYNEPNGNQDEPNNVVVESNESGSFYDEIPIKWPVRSHSRVSSPYGYRTDPFTRKRAFHHGIDIPMPISTAIYATASGVVEKTGYNRRSGWYIIIKHKNYKTIYAHLNRIIVKEGRKVQPGTFIAYSGNTGRSTGPHLHYQICKLDGKTIDPIDFIKNYQDK